jgi:hypothetical protein
MELKAGIWIAQGPSTNILLRLGGKAPMLEVIGAIDLNHFYDTGKARELTSESGEVIDILSYPENYNFFPPAISDAIKNIEGIGSYKFEAYNATPEEKRKIVEMWKCLLPLYGFDKAKAKLRLYIKNELNMTLGQAALFSNEIVNYVKKL